jgi:hypothetical protein
MLLPKPNFANFFTIFFQWKKDQNQGYLCHFLKIAQRIKHPSWRLLAQSGHPDGLIIDSFVTILIKASFETQHAEFILRASVYGN